MSLKTRNIYALLAAVCVIVLYSLVFANAEDGFSVKRIGNIHPYADNSFKILSSEEGSLEIRIHDSVCVYRTISQQISAGETTIHWDGCGYNREKLYEKTYTITAELACPSGKVYTVSFDSPVEYPAQCLQYALTSSELLYLDCPETWFVEFRTVTKGTVVFEIISVSDPEEKYTYPVAATGGKITRKTFPEISGKKEKPCQGEYTLRVYEVSRPEEMYESGLRIAEHTPDPEPVQVTGEIMPDRNMTDQEIWQIMMKPSVVVDIDSFKHQDVYSDPDPASPSLGTLHGQSQCLKVIRIDGEWALIGAWNHEEAAYIEGWVPVSRLKTESPRGEYGILIDKRKQTLSVYSNGELLDTLLISSGRAEKNSLYQETSAGVFLTGYHRVNFSMNGKKYDYVIQYDGGNLLHQTPYDWGQQKKDFTLGRGYLGAKASHACIRIQPEPGEGGLNAYWIFTHIPYHTRVIILDDPWEHEAMAEKLKRTDREDVDISAFRFSDAQDSDSEALVSITFGGRMIPGGVRSFNNRKESFSSFLSDKGYEIPLQGLKPLFSRDDMTCISLHCPIQKTEDDYPGEKGTLFASFGTEKILDGASVELVQMTDSIVSSAGMEACESTAGIISEYADVLLPGMTYTRMIKGHLFGFAQCTDKEYLRDPEIIDKRLSDLKAEGCERLIMLFDWDESNGQAHSIVQEAMAHRSIRAGADLVVGNCRGVVQGVDLIEDVPVVYSTGDLLDGSTSARPKNQQGILIRAVFSFDTDSSILCVTVIPVMPFGSGDAKMNEYSPSAELSSGQTSDIIRYLWQDSTDQAMDQFYYYRK